MKKSRGELLFIVLMASFSVVLLAGTSRLSDKSSIIPFWVSIIILALLLIDLFVKSKTSVCIKASETAQNRNILAVIFWLGLTIILIYLLGMLFAVVISSFVYFQYFIFKQIKKSVIASLSVFSFIYIIFVVLAKFNLYRGIFF